MQRGNKIALCMMAALCAGSLSAQRDAKPFKDRMIDFKDRAKEKIAAILVYLPVGEGDKSRDAQLKRLSMYKKLQEKNWWRPHPKRWIPYIVNGKVKQIGVDKHVRDEDYVACYVVYKELEKGQSLTEEEIDAARIEAMDVLEEYRRVKGID